MTFSDEKKFSLDSRDEIQCYWQDLCKEHIFLKRSFGGGSVMDGGTFSINGGLTKCNKVCQSLKKFNPFCWLP